LQKQLSTQCSNIGTELIIDYGGEFTTYEIFQSREALINWAREIVKSQGFFIVTKKSEAPRNGKNGRVLLSCDRKGTYRNRNVKTNDKKKIEQQSSKTTYSKKCGCPFLLKGKELSNEVGWVLLIACGIHNHLPAKYLEGHFFARKLSEEDKKLVVDMSHTLVRSRDILNTLK